MPQEPPPTPPHLELVATGTDDSGTDDGVDPNAPPGEFAEEGGVRPPQVAQTIGDFEVPYGYELWADGLYKTEPDSGRGENEEPSFEPPTIFSLPSPRHKRINRLQRITTRPIWPRAFAESLDTGEHLVELSTTDPYNRDREMKAEWVGRGVLCDRQKLKLLGGQGFPVNSENAGLVLEFLDLATAGPTIKPNQLRAQANNANLPCIMMARRCGPYYIKERHGWGWLIGETWVGASDEDVAKLHPRQVSVQVDPRFTVRVVKGLKKSGSSEAWWKKFDEIASHGALARWSCYSAFAAPLLRWLNRRTFVIHHWDHTGAGKSALGGFITTAWGDRALLEQTFNSTEIGLIETFSHITDIPVVFDELQSVDKHTDVSKLIYSLVLERPRQRAKKYGGLADQWFDGWRTVIRTTGEEELIGKGRTDLGGQANRVLQVKAPGLDSETAKALHEWISGEGHYGHAGVEFLGAIWELVNGHDPTGILKEHFDTIYEKIVEITNRRGARTGHMATIALAHVLCAWLLRGQDYDAAMKDALDDARVLSEHIAFEEDEDTMTPGERGLRILRDHYTTHPGEFINAIENEDGTGYHSVRTRDYDQTKRTITGIEAMGPTGRELWLIRGRADKIMKAAGLSPKRVWTDIRDLGIRVVDADGRSPKRQLGKFASRPLVFRYNKFFDVPDVDPYADADEVVPEELNREITVDSRLTDLNTLL